MSTRAVLVVRLNRAHDVDDDGEPIDTYVELTFDGTEKKSSTLKNSLHPMFNASFRFRTPNMNMPLDLTLKQDKMLRDKTIGSTSVDLSSLPSNETQELTLPLSGSSATLEISVAYYPDGEEEGREAEEKAKQELMMAEQQKLMMASASAMTSANMGEYGVGGGGLQSSGVVGVAQPMYGNTVGGMVGQPMGQPLYQQQQQGGVVMDAPPAYDEGQQSSSAGGASGEVVIDKSNGELASTEFGLDGVDPSTVTTIILADNYVASLVNLDQFSSLTVLNLRNNSLTSLDGIGSQCPALLMLDASDNDIEDLGDLKMCGRMQQINLSKNYLEDYDDLVELAQAMPYLALLDIRSNNLSDRQNAKVMNAFAGRARVFVSSEDSD